jgi:methionyl-tRNA formyltransferase
MRIVVISPNKYSLYTLAVCESLLRERLQLVGVFYLKFSIRRILYETKKSPKLIFNKFLKKVLFRKRLYKNVDSVEGLLGYRKQIGGNLNSINDLEYGNIMIQSFDEFNTTDCLASLKKLKPDLILFTGGGILGAELLKIPTIGVLNAHMGILPEYRGMHVAEWAYLKNDYSKIGCTTHIMERNVDTGRVIDVRYISPQDIGTYDELYSIFEKNMCISLVDSCKLLSKNPQYQKFISPITPLYFTMPEKLLNIVKLKIKTNSNK